MTKKILVIGMLDSIHLGRWLTQFNQENLDFIIMPSKKFRRIHPLIKSLTQSSSNFKFANFFYKYRFAGYIDFAIYEVLYKLFKLNLRINFLNKILLGHEFFRIHALELQGAGYLCLDWSLKYKKEFDDKLILTNWGSDIYHFYHDENHLLKIQGVLKISRYYSAECVRDYDLATRFGFKGVFLPCNPNSGGIEIPVEQNLSQTSLRNNIIVKGYGGNFGRSNLLIPILNKILTDFPLIDIFYYSVTPDIEILILDQINQFPKRIDYSTIKNSLTHNELLFKFRNARIYIGLSTSDGISTSFLEALCTGAYPIQSNTSCADEWVSLGIIASIVNLDSFEIENQIRNALMDDKYVDDSAVNNLEVAANRLNYKKVKIDSLKFYY